MTRSQVFPTGAGLWFLGAAVMCALDQDWRMVKFYTLSAAINWVMRP